MIAKSRTSRRRLQSFCCEPIENIENFEEAERSEELYDCHHRLETDLCVSAEWLKEHDMYYNRPASELIFLPRRVHLSIHHSGVQRFGSENTFFGRKHSEESIQKMRDAKLGKHCGEESYFYGLIGEKHPAFKKICPLVLYTYTSILHYNIEQISTELNLSRKTVKRRLTEFTSSF